MPRGSTPLKLATGQSTSQLGGDGEGVDEKRTCRLHVVAASHLTHPSEELVQVLAQGAQMPPGRLLLPVRVRRLLPAMTGLNEDLSTSSRTFRPTCLRRSGLRGRSSQDARRWGVPSVRVSAVAIRDGDDVQAG